MSKLSTTTTTIPSTKQQQRQQKPLIRSLWRRLFFNIVSSSSSSSSSFNYCWKKMMAILDPLFQLVRYICSLLERLWRAWTGRNEPVIVLDTGRRIRMGKQIAEGGFSWIFEARDDNNNNNNHYVHYSTTHKKQHHPQQHPQQQYVYALKRIYLADQEMVQNCLKEIAIHRSVRHANVMPLLGMTLLHDESVCYILFPLVPHSLRMEVNQRIFLDYNNNNKNKKTPPPTHNHTPWSSELDLLRIFLGIVDGVGALHAANYSHRDVKLENVLLQPNHTQYTPILTDFGSAGPLVETIATRRRVLEIVEHASQHTTMPYRPPELFDGGVRAGDNEIMDYTKVDVWSLGCTLFGMMYGASPFECEFVKRPSHTTTTTMNRHDYSYDDYSCPITIVECTQLRILANVPTPPPQSMAAKWYSMEIRNLVLDMLHHDRHQRPTLTSVMNQTEDIIRKLGGSVRIPQEEMKKYNYNNNFDDDGHVDGDDDDLDESDLEVARLNTYRNFV